MNLIPEASELDEHPEPSVPEAFTVRDVYTANWVIRRIVECRQYAERVREWAQAEVRRMQRDEQFFMHRFGQQLESWTRRQLDHRRRSLRLPAGTVGLRTSPPHLTVVDQAILLDWCRRHCVEPLMFSVRATGADALELERWHHQHPSSIRGMVSYSMIALNAHFRASGELPPGVELVSSEKFFVR